MLTIIETVSSFFSIIFFIAGPKFPIRKAIIKNLDPLVIKEMTIKYAILKCINPLLIVNNLKGTGEKIASVASSAAQPFQEGFSDVMGDLKGFNKDEEGNARIIDMTKFQEALAKAGGDINKACKEYLGTVIETNNELDKQKQKIEKKHLQIFVTDRI